MFEISAQRSSAAGQRTYTKADLCQTSIGDRACVADHVRYMRNSATVFTLPPWSVVGREIDQQGHARQAQPSDLASGFGAFLPEDGSRSTRLTHVRHSEVLPVLPFNIDVGQTCGPLTNDCAQKSDRHLRC